MRLPVVSGRARPRPGQLQLELRSLVALGGDGPNKTKLQNQAQLQRGGWRGKERDKMAFLLSQKHSIRKPWNFSWPRPRSPWRPHHSRGHSPHTRAQKGLASRRTCPAEMSPVGATAIPRETRGTSLVVSSHKDLDTDFATNGSQGVLLCL